VARVVAAAEPGTDFVTGAGFRDALWPDLPHKDLLAAALPDRAVALSSQDLHTLWLSPAALAAIGFDHPTGVLVEDECYRATASAAERAPSSWMRRRAAAHCPMCTCASRIPGRIVPPSASKPSPVSVPAGTIAPIRPPRTSTSTSGPPGPLRTFVISTRRA
jgi:hypothetical protein